MQVDTVAQRAALHATASKDAAMPAHESRRRICTGMAAILAILADPTMPWFSQDPWILAYFYILKSSK